MGDAHPAKGRRHATSPRNPQVDSGGRIRPTRPVPGGRPLPPSRERQPDSLPRGRKETFALDRTVKPARASSQTEVKPHLRAYRVLPWELSTHRTSTLCSLGEAQHSLHTKSSVSYPPVPQRPTARAVLSFCAVSRRARTRSRALDTWQIGGGSLPDYRHGQRIP